MKKMIATFLNAILFTIILALQLIFTLIFSFRYLTTEENIYKIFSNIDVEKLLDESNVPINRIYEGTGSLRISREDTLKMLNSDALKRYLSKYIYTSIDSLKNNTKISDITITDLKSVVTSLETENITIQNKEEILTSIDDNKVEIERYLNSVQNTIYEKLTPNNLRIISFFLSPNMFVIYGVILVALYLITCLFRWSIYKPLLNFGIILSIISALFILVAMYFDSNFTSSYKEYINTLQKSVIAFNSLYLFIGMVFLNLYMLIKKLKKS